MTKRASWAAANRNNHRCNFSFSARELKPVQPVNDQKVLAMMRVSKSKASVGRTEDASRSQVF
jgi:hypothetical protein